MKDTSIIKDTAIKRISLLVPMVYTGSTVNVRFQTNIIIILIINYDVSSITQTSAVTRTIQTHTGFSGQHNIQSIINHHQWRRYR